LKEISDNKILDLVSDNQSFDQGFELLVKKYQERLYWQIRGILHIHEDADDVIQNTFIKIFKNIKGFKGESQLYTWLYTIARNECFNFLKKRKKKEGLSSEFDQEYLDQALTADPYFDGDKTQRLLIKAIEQLPVKQKEVFRLRYFDEMPYKQMSELLNTSTGALKASFHHAVKKVESYLRENINYV